MNTAVQCAFDYSALERSDAEFLRERTGEIRELARTTMAGIVRLGGFLAEVRDRLLYGQFEAWLTAEFNWSRRTAYNLINVHAAFGRANFAQLTIDVSALYLLAAPSTPETVRQDVLKRAAGGEKIGLPQAKQAIAGAFKTDTYETVSHLDVGLAKLIQERKAEIAKAAAEEEAYQARIERRDALMASPEYKARVAESAEKFRAADPVGRVTEYEQKWMGCVRMALEVLLESEVSVERGRALVLFSKFDRKALNEMADYLRGIAQ